MNRGAEGEKHEYQYGKNENYVIGCRGKCRNGSGGHQTVTNQKL